MTCTKLLTNMATFGRLERHCSNDHLHETRGQTPEGHRTSAEERAYPWQPCRSIAIQVLLQCLIFNTMASGAKRHLPPVVSEFKTIFNIGPRDPMPEDFPRQLTPRLWAHRKRKTVTRITAAPNQFVKEACHIGRPIRLQSMFPDEMRSVVTHCHGQCPAYIAKERGRGRLRSENGFSPARNFSPWRLS